MEEITGVTEGAGAGEGRQVHAGVLSDCTCVASRSDCARLRSVTGAGRHADRAEEEHDKAPPRASSGR